MFGSRKTDFVAYVDTGMYFLVPSLVTMCNVMILICVPSLRPIYVGVQDHMVKLILVTGVLLCSFLSAFYCPSQ